MRDLLADRFLYDRWASELWLGSLSKFKDVDRAASVLRHIFAAQHIWLRRCLSDEEVADLPDDLGQALAFVGEGWVDLVRISDPGAYVSYTTMRGESCFNTVEQIAWHVLNHGTYHRGQLRGLAQAEGWDDFEDTDLIRWFRLQDSQ